MPAKTPSKGKKAAAPKAPKKAAKAKKPPVVEEESPAGEEPEEDEEDLELEGDEEEAPRAAAKPVAKKPAAAPAARGKLQGEDAPAVVPARRLTPEAKARVNEMVRKGMSLGDALKAAAAWETFVAPVKDEPAKLVGKSFEGGGSRFRPRQPAEEEPPTIDDVDEPPSAIEAED